MRRVHVRKAVLFRGWTWRIKNDTKAGITGSYRDPHSAARELLVLSGETGPSSTPNMDDNFHDIPESPRFCKMFWKTIAGASLLIGAGVMLGRASLSFPRQQPQIRPQAIVQAHRPCDNPWTSACFNRRRYPEMFYLCPWLRLHQNSQPGNHGKRETNRSVRNNRERHSLISAVGARKRSSLR